MDVASDLGGQISVLTIILGIVMTKYANLEFIIEAMQTHQDEETHVSSCEKLKLISGICPNK